MKTLILTFILSISVLRAGEVDPIVGKWLFLGNILVEINADGTATAANKLTAKWIYLNNPELERYYRFVWNEGVYIDKLKLSRDHSKLDGYHENKKGDNKVFANRAIEN